MTREILLTVMTREIRYPRPSTVRLALYAIQHPRADLDGRAKPNTEQFKAHCARIDAIESVLRRVVSGEVKS